MSFDASVHILTVRHQYMRLQLYYVGLYAFVGVLVHMTNMLYTRMRV